MSPIPKSEHCHPSLEKNSCFPPSLGPLNFDPTHTFFHSHFHVLMRKTSSVDIWGLTGDI